MRTVALLVGLLLLTTTLAGCARGTDPWDTTGWNVEALDYETDFWTPSDECPAPRPACPPTPATRPAPQVPKWSTPAPGGTVPPPPAWPQASAPAPRPAPMQPVPRSVPVVPPPPPPPYPLPR